ncbi:MAG: hypothetical protein K8H88_13840, partial [Sandaracinaceae bacterium]|nr:hypothetical protein [Sandaracinaceae bacterium]
TGPSGEVHRNEVAVLGGAGFIAATEGTLTARFAGTFTADAGGSTAIDVALPVALLERGDRSRGVVVLTTDLGGLYPGTFDGTIMLESSLVSGGTSTSSPLAARLHFNAPDLYALEPAVASLGRIVTVRGAGLLGGRDRPSETTILRIAGTFTPEAGASEPFGPEELVPEWISGEEVRFIVEPEVRGGALVSALFGHARGTFTGTAIPVAIDGTDELEGDAVPFQLTLGPLRQVVHVRFLPGFYTALSRFGLASAAEEIEQQVLMRIQGIYSGWGVDVRLEEPTDYGRSSYSVLEIGGADPNGSGLFGYDNTPGKDVGNVRLFDAIGGANAQTQLDGYPGYGGVFVESVLYWSSHPELPGARPASAPDPEPLFDEVFDPVRAQAATLAEARGEGDATRVAQVARAIRALASIIGETAAHELGHSLGMAQPYGPPTVYHNDFDGDGCLMDTGGDRPLGERMQEPGFTPTHLCYDHPSYLDMILPR